MHKRLFIAIILMFTAAVLCYMSIYMTTVISQNITQKIDDIEDKISENETDLAIKLASELIDSWERQYKVLSLYTSHEHLERSEVAINSVVNYLQLQDYTAALIVCEDIRVCAEHLLISEKPSISNIF